MGSVPGSWEVFLQQLMMYLLAGCKDMVNRGVALESGTATILPGAAWVVGGESRTGAFSPLAVTLGAKVGPHLPSVATGAAAAPPVVGGATQLSKGVGVTPLAVAGALQASSGVGDAPPAVAIVAQVGPGVGTTSPEVAGVSPR